MASVELDGINFSVFVGDNPMRNTCEELKHIRGYVKVETELLPFHVDVGYYAELSHEEFDVVRCAVNGGNVSLKFLHDQYPYSSILLTYTSQEMLLGKTIQLKFNRGNSSEYVEKHIEILNMRKELERLRVENAELKTENAELHTENKSQM